MANLQISLLGSISSSCILYSKVSIFYPYQAELFFTPQISSRNLDRVRKLKSGMTRLTARVQKVWFCIFISLATSFYLKLLLFSSLECVLIVLFTVFQISCCNLSSPVFPMLRSDCEPCRCKRLDSFFVPHACRGFACLLRGLTVAIESIFWPFGIDKLGIDYREQRFFSSTFSLFTSKMVTNI